MTDRPIILIALGIVLAGIVYNQSHQAQAPPELAPVKIEQAQPKPDADAPLSKDDAAFFYNVVATAWTYNDICERIPDVLTRIHITGAAAGIVLDEAELQKKYAEVKAIAIQGGTEQSCRRMQPAIENMKHRTK